MEHRRHRLSRILRDIMSRLTWVDRVNQSSAIAPPRSGKGATTKAWREYAESLNHTVPNGAGRSAIIALVENGPPPRPPRPRNTVKVEGAVFEATRSAVETADHLTPLDKPAVAVLLDLAATIDGIDHRPANAPMDNVTIPMFLRYAEQLGLTPMARSRLDIKPDQGPSKLANLRAIRGGRAAG